MYKKKINLADMSNYQLGIIYGIGSYIECENSLVFRHREKYFLEILQPIFKNKIYVQRSNTNIQYVMKNYITNIDTLENWNMRNDDIRTLPKLGNYNDFLRAYIELHGCWDYCTSYKRNGEKYYRLRLRIYGNYYMILNLNEILSREIGVTIKKVQTVHNNKTGYIQYTSLDEIITIRNYIKGNPYNKSYWDNVDEKIKGPRKK